MLFCFVARRSKLKCTARLGYCFLLVYTQHTLSIEYMRPTESSLALLVPLRCSPHTVRFLPRPPCGFPGPLALPDGVELERASSNLHTLHDTAQQVLLVFTPPP